jgi:hypothetical protein
VADSGSRGVLVAGPGRRGPAPCGLGPGQLAGQCLGGGIDTVAQLAAGGDPRRHRAPARHPQHPDQLDLASRVWGGGGHPGQGGSSGRLGVDGRGRSGRRPQPPGCRPGCRPAGDRSCGDGMLAMAVPSAWIGPRRHAPAETADRTATGPCPGSSQSLARPVVPGGLRRLADRSTASHMAGKQSGQTNRPRHTHRIIAVRSLSTTSRPACGRPLRGHPRSPNPGRRARPHRNACRLHGLTGQWTHFSRACPADGASRSASVVALEPSV